MSCEVSEKELEQFFHYLRFPSVSADPTRRPELEACAFWLGELLKSWGMDAAIQTFSRKAPPVVLARSPFQAGHPTLLIYGHYDVQPAEPLELWDSAPFEPALREGKIYGRGATDNKGQTFSLLLGLQRWLAARQELPINVVVLVEGEEEVGSPHLQDFLQAHAQELKCDVALIADTSMIEAGWPALTLGLRGILCLDLIAYGPARDIHSGIFGGAAPNPALALSRVLASLHDENGRIAIPGFYESVREPSDAEKQSWQQLPWGEEWFIQATGIPPKAGEKDRSLLEKIWSRPTAEINGLTAGHQGVGSKTIIPASASAKLTFRLVPEQDSKKTARFVQDWLEKRLQQEGIRGEAIIDHTGEPFFISPEEPALQVATRSVETVFGVPPALMREGLSIPAAVMLKKNLGAPVVLLGLGLPDCQAHGPNESFPLAHLELGAAFFTDFLGRLAHLR